MNTHTPVQQTDLHYKYRGYFQGLQLELPYSYSYRNKFYLQGTRIVMVRASMTEMIHPDATHPWLRVVRQGRILSG